MTRHQTIDRINAKLAELDDERLREVAEIIDAIDEESVLARALTAEERALIEQSRDDFRHGRVLSLEEAKARTDAFLAARRRQRAAE